MSSAVSFIGIDVGNKTVSVAAGGAVHDFPHTAAGIRRLIDWASSRCPEPIHAVCESSGPYSIKLWGLLDQHGVPLAIVPPQRVRFNAKALGRHCKTDRIDAQVILDYAMHAKPEPWTAPPEEQARLASLQQAMLDIKAEKRRWLNRRHAMEQSPFTPDEVLALSTRMEEFYDQQLAQLNASIKKLLASPALAERYALLLGIPGIGPQTAIMLLTRAEIILSRNDRQLTAYAGLAPMHKQSGSSVRGKSHIAPGDSQLRTLLYMAALSACKQEPLKEVYTRLRNRGKPGKVALIAVARHLLHIAASVLKSGKPFYVPEPR